MAKKETEKKITAPTAPKTVKKEAANEETAARSVKKETAQAVEAKVSQERPVRPAPAKVAAAKQAPAKPAGPKAPVAHGVGRRKSAVARVWLRRGKGAVVVNDKDHLSYFDTELSRRAAALPFEIYTHAQNYDAHANVVGGGKPAQADAVKLGIARALLELNEDVRPLFKEYGLLSVDSRVKERKKYGQKAARRKFQFVKR